MRCKQAGVQRRCSWTMQHRSSLSVCGSAPVAVAPILLRGHRAAMHDIRLIRDDPAAFDAALTRRGAAPASGALLALDERRRAIATALQAAQGRRNEASKAIGQ